MRRILISERLQEPGRQQQALSARQEAIAGQIDPGVD
jgi:hypothetical protein